MRRPTLLALSLLLASLTALAPSASASDMGCPGWTMDFPGDVTLYHYYPCGYKLTVHEDQPCPAGDDHWTGYGGSDRGAWVKTCGAPAGGLLDDAIPRTPISENGYCKPVPENAVAAVDDGCDRVEQRFACKEPARSYHHLVVHGFALYSCPGL